MADLISRAAAISEVMQTVEQHKHEVYRGELLHYTGVKAIIEALPAVDAVPVVHGRWIINKYGETVCSECENNALQVLTGCLVNRHFEPHKSKFCPECGAKMDGERRDSE